jgi:hypothetical protein
MFITKTFCHGAADRSRGSGRHPAAREPGGAEAAEELVRARARRLLRRLAHRLHERRPEALPEPLRDHVELTQSCPLSGV